MQGQQGKSSGFEIVGRRQAICLTGSRKDQGSAATNGKAESGWFNETTRPTYKHVKQKFHAGLAGTKDIKVVAVLLFQHVPSLPPQDCWTSGSQTKPLLIP